MAAMVGTGVFAGTGISPASAESSKDLRAKAARLADRLEELGHEIVRLAESYNEALGAADELDVQVQASTEQVQALESELGGMRKAVREFAVRMYASGGDMGGLGELLGGSTELTDRVIRDQYASLALASGQQASNDLESKLNDLAAAKRKLQRQKEAKAKLVTTLESRRSEAESKQKQLEKLESETSADLKKALAEEEDRRVAESRARAEADAAARRRGNGNSNNTGGGRGNGGGGSTNTGGGRGGTSNGGGGGGGTSNGGGGGGSPRPGRDVPPPSPGASGAVAAAKSQIGVPYIAFLAQPGVGFDCSGLTMWAWARAGVRLPHYSRAQYATIDHVDPDDALPGDLLFFYSPISHVAMYLGGNLMIDAARPGRPISIHGFKWANVTGVGRPR